MEGTDEQRYEREEEEERPHTSDLFQPRTDCIEPVSEEVINMDPRIKIIYKIES